ncbi:MAG: type IV toxin-antitoxin system AbiEi family antitoxin domain-containing protein, partial [Geminicoccaceae bacterium]|nr:type IV toxin-antitoxin system AbiEi family antitoxin domain-containing protein [Geminicoccaceae bacterium]
MSQNRILEMLSAGHLVTLRDISSELDVSPKRAQDFISRMIRDGLVERPKPGCYVLSGKGARVYADGIEPPRVYRRVIG